MAIEIGGYRPGALAAIVGLHAGYYARHWNFGLPFETKVGAELAEFLARHDRGLALSVRGNDGVRGDVARLA